MTLLLLLAPALLVIVLLILTSDALWESIAWLMGLWIVLSFLALFALIWAGIIWLSGDVWFLPVGMIIFTVAGFAYSVLAVRLEYRIHNSGLMGKRPLRYLTLEQTK